jgi:hypothetical protein
MSTPIEELNEEFLLHGKYLERSELILRLNKMGVNIDNLRDLPKEKLVESYNTEIFNIQRRIKIKSIIESDIIDRPEKNLKRKRERNGNSNTKERDNSLLSPSVNKANYQRNLRSGASSSNRKKIEPRRSSRKTTPRFSNKIGQKMSIPELLDVIHKNYDEGKKNQVRNQQTKQEMNEKIKYNNNISFSKETGAISKIDDNLNNYIEISNKPTNRQINYYDFDTTDDKNIRMNLKQTSNSNSKQKSNIPISDYDNTINPSNFNLDKTKNLTKDYLNKFAPDLIQKNSKNISHKKSPYNEIKNNLLDEQDFQMQYDSYPLEENPFQSEHRTIKSSVSLHEQGKNKLESEKNTSGKKTVRSRQTVQDLKKSVLLSEITSVTRQKSLPGSSKNIQEILKNVEIKSPRPVMSAHEIMSSNNRNRVQSGSVKSLRSITVSIRDAAPTSDFTEKNLQEKMIENLSIWVRKIKSTDLKVLIPGIIVVTGSLYLTFMFFNSIGDRNFKNVISLLEVSQFKVQICVVVIFFIIFLVSKNMSEKRYFKKIANEDYQKILQLLENNYNTEEQPLGIFETTFIKSTSLAHFMTEESYRKNVLPLLDEIVKQKNQLQVKDIIIQDQSHKTWDFLHPEMEEN